MLIFKSLSHMLVLILPAFFFPVLFVFILQLSNRTLNVLKRYKSYHLCSLLSQYSLVRVLLTRLHSLHYIFVISLEISLHFLVNLIYKRLDFILKVSYMACLCISKSKYTWKFPILKPDMVVITLVIYRFTCKIF